MDYLNPGSPGEGGVPGGAPGPAPIPTTVDVVVYGEQLLFSFNDDLAWQDRSPLTTVDAPVEGKAT